MWPGNIRVPNPNGSLRIITPRWARSARRSRTGSRTPAASTTALTSDLLPSSRQVGFFGTGTLRLSAKTDLYAEVLASQSLIKHEDPPTPVSTTASQHGTPFVLPASSPYYPTGLTLPSNWSLAYRTVPLGPATTEVDSRNVKLLVGIRSQQWGWDLDGAVSTNRSWARETYVSGMVDAGKLSAAFKTGLLNPFGPSGPEGDALLAASELRGLSRESTGLTQSIDLRGVRQFGELAGGPLGLALGIEARRETLDDVKMPIALDVLQDVPAAPKQGSRRVQAAYAEIVAPVLKGLELQVAARVDHYSDFGTAFSPKVGDPLRTHLRRVAARLDRPGLPGAVAERALCAAGTYLRGARDPQPERPGALPRHAPGFRLCADGRPRDRWQSGAPAAAVEPDQSRHRRFARGGLAGVAGPVADPHRQQHQQHQRQHHPRQSRRVRQRSQRQARPGRPRLPEPARADRGDRGAEREPRRLARERRRRVAADAETRDRDRPHLGTRGRDIRAVRAPEHLQHQHDRPDRRHLASLASVASANLDRNHWIATLLYRYRHGYNDVLLLPDGTPHHVAAYQIWDAHAIFTVARNVKLLFGIENLLNTAPPLSTVGDPLLGYDPSYADPRGRRWTVGLRASWT